MIDFKKGIKNISAFRCSFLLFLFLLVLCASIKAGAKKSNKLITPLFDFEDQKEVDSFVIRKTNPPAKLTRSKKYATKGKYCVKFSTPTCKKGFPAAISHKPAEREFYLYKKILVDVYNPNKKPVRVHFYVYLADGNGANAYMGRLAKPGHSTVEVKITDRFSSAPVVNWHFYRPPKTLPATVYFDNVRLVSEDFSVILAQAQKTVKAEIKKIKELAGKDFDRQLSIKFINKLKSSLLELERNMNNGTYNKRKWLKDAKTLKDKASELLKQAVRSIEKGKVDKFINEFNKTAKGKTLWYACADGMQKVARNDEVSFEGTSGGALKVEMAANEYEGCQLVLRSKKALKNVKVAVSQLKGPMGTVIPPKQIKILPVGYVDTSKTTKTSYKVKYQGWHPDPLLPFLSEFNIEANVWQPVWFDIKTRSNQKPGTYKGIIKVTADDGISLKVPIKVKVWNFKVPHEYHFPLATTSRFDTYETRVYCKKTKVLSEYMSYLHKRIDCENLTPEAKKLYIINRKLDDMILAHRLVPTNLYAWVPPRISDVKHWVKSGVRWFNILYVLGPKVEKGEQLPESYKKKVFNFLKDYVPKLKKAGLLKMGYIYAFDEINERNFAAAKDILAEIKRRYPEIPIMTTAKDETFGEKSGLKDCVDIWVPLTPEFNKTMAQHKALRKKGKEIWWYVCCSPVHPYPNWFIEFSGTEQRSMMGFMPYKFKADGFLYYALSAWKDIRNNLIKIIDKGPLTDFSGRCFGGNINGDGLIFYPGPNGPIPSIRAKCIRDGLEDYEYLYLLKNLVESVQSKKRKAPHGWLKKARKALEISPEVATSMTVFSRESKNILEARKNIALLICEFKKFQNK